MSEINVRDSICENCAKFSHCNNNDLVCIKKFQQLKATLNEIKEIIIKRQKEHYCYCDECSPFKEILQKIKEVKGNE